MKTLISVILTLSLFASNSPYKGDTLASVVLAGSVIRAKISDHVVKKYKRKDCPICKGKGWHMSGDGIKKIDCNDCEP